MKTLNKLALLFAISGSLNGIAQKNEVWLERDDYSAYEVWGDNVGDDVKVDITCSGEEVSDCLIEARKRAIYELIFKGYNASPSGGSAITQLIADKSAYDQNKEIFIDYINTEGKGLQYAQAKINTSKPGGEVKGWEGTKKKLKKVTVTVTLRINNIREDLEKQGLVKSLAGVVESLGFEPTIIIKPNDAWLKKLGLYKEEDNQGKTQIIRQYEKIGTNQEYLDIVQVITRSIGDGFKIDQIAAQLNSSNDEALRNQLSDVELQESSEDILARTLQADIYLEIGYEKNLISGGQQTQLSLTINGVDPLTNSAKEMPGRKITKETSGDNYAELLEQTLKAATDEFKALALKFLVKRTENGIPGKMLFKIASDLEGEKTFNSYINADGEKVKFSELVDEAVEELSKKGTAFGTQTSTRREYDVLIDSKTTNRKGKPVSNSYEKVAEKMAQYLKKYSDLHAYTKPVGKGKVVVIFTKEEPK